MKILIAGATGFVGSHLVQALLKKDNYEVRVLTRNKFKNIDNNPQVEFFEWDPSCGYIEEGAFENVDIVVNLSGENVGDGRWTKAKKARIRNSRINSAKLLVDKMRELKKPPPKIIQASAIGIYGDGFLSSVCKDWEAEILNQKIDGLKSYVVRMGIVLGEDGGVLEKMLTSIRFKIATQLGSGNQAMNWIHIDDLVNQIIYLIENDVSKNIFDAISPKTLTHKEFISKLGRLFNCITTITIPNGVLKLIFGEMSELFLQSTNIKPVGLIDEGFKFKYENIDNALVNILMRNQRS